MFVDLIILKIKKSCKEKNITINKLSKLSGITQSTLDCIVNGKSYNPRILTLKKICDGLSISLEEFFSDEIFK